MPDISMCNGRACKAQNKCHRCPASGTVANLHRQFWFTTIPGNDETCPEFVPGWAEEPTLEQRLLRTVTYFASFMISKDNTRRNYAASEFKQHIADSFYRTIHSDESQLADDLIAWLKDSMVDSDDVIDIIENNLLGVICLMDMYDGSTKYIDQVVQYFDKPQPALTVIQGNRSVN